MSIVRTHADHDLTALLGSIFSSKAGAACPPPVMTSKSCLCILSSQLNNFYHQQNTLFFLVSFLNALFSPPSIMTIVKNADRHFLSQLHRVKTKLPQTWYWRANFFIPGSPVAAHFKQAACRTKKCEGRRMCEFRIICFHRCIVGHQHLCVGLMGLGKVHL